jgi:hypothetical protein
LEPIEVPDSVTTIPENPAMPMKNSIREGSELKGGISLV